jgi:HNH endonuclease
MAGRRGEQRSRHIPERVRDEVRSASGFVCAWDGVPLTHIHHIVEFAEGGPSTPDNLIALCPNCHAAYHRREISRDELQRRRSDPEATTQRGNGTLIVPVGDLTIRVGGIEFLNSEIPLQVLDDPPLITLRREGGRLLVNFRYFDRRDRLVVCMTGNRWWLDLSSGLSFRANDHSLQITEVGGRVILSFEVEESTIQIAGELWVRGGRFELTRNRNISPLGDWIENLRFDASNLQVPSLVLVYPGYPDSSGGRLPGCFVWESLSATSAKGEATGSR